MKFYDESIQVRKKDDKTFYLSIRLNEEVIIVKTINKKDLEQLKHTLQELLK